MDGHWAVVYIEDLYKRGVLLGNADGRVKTDDEISRAEAIVLLTRAEMAVFVMKAFKLEQAKKTELNYIDSESIPLWSKNYIESASHLGIITGYSDNTLRPNKFIKRAEMFKIISKCLEKMP